MVEVRLKGLVDTKKLVGVDKYMPRNSKEVAVSVKVHLDVL